MHFSPAEVGSDRAGTDVHVVSGLLSGASGIAFLLVPRGSLSGSGVWFAVALALVLALAGFTLPRSRALGRGLSTLGVLGAAGATALPSMSPIAMLWTLVGVVLALELVWSVRRAADQAAAAPTSCFVAACVSAVLGAACVLVRGEPSEPCALAMNTSLAATLVLGAWVVGREPERVRRALPRLVVGALSALAGLVVYTALAGPRELWLTAWALLVLGLMVVTRPRRAAWVTQVAGSRSTPWIDLLLSHPERAFVLTFATLCAVGGLLLMAPFSAAAGHSIGLADALFTSVSAVCVTGLTVVDTEHAFSLAGQVCLLALIQLGGLGILTFSTAAAHMMGRRVSVRHEAAMARLISSEDRGKLFLDARRLIVMTFALEAGGALILSAAFVAAGDGFGMAAWRGVFTAVSAFCNAGFALQSANLVPYQSDPVVLHTVGALIVLGGLSPVAVLCLPKLVRWEHKRIPIDVKISIVTSAALLVLGTSFFLVLEWDGGLADLSPVDRLHNAWFHSVSLRTAGFNAIDLGGLRDPTVLLMILWMLIGGSPGGTAGGIKTTTIAVLGLSAINIVRGRSENTVFGWTIATQTIQKAAAVLVVAGASAVVATLSLMLTQAVDSRAGVFEVFSALGTVGLSLGATTELDGFGQAVIMACMFSGRVGGITLLVLIARRRPAPRASHPEAEIAVG